MLFVRILTAKHIDFIVYTWHADGPRSTPRHEIQVASAVTVALLKAIEDFEWYAGQEKLPDAAA